jgi:hypothetical protein
LLRGGRETAGAGAGAIDVVEAAEAALTDAVEGEVEVESMMELGALEMPSASDSSTRNNMCIKRQTYADVTAQPCCFTRKRGTDGFVV